MRIVAAGVVFLVVAAVAVIASALHVPTVRLAESGIVVSGAKLAAAAPGSLVVLTRDDHLQRIDIASMQSALSCALPLLEGEEVQSLVVHDGSALVSTRRVLDGLGCSFEHKLHRIDVATMRLAQTLVNSADGQLVAFHGTTAIFRDGESHGVRFVDLPSGKTLGSVGQQRGIASGRIALDGDRLFVPLHYAGGLLVVDAKERKCVDLIETEEWLHDARIRDGEVYVAWSSPGSGYGRIDLRRRKLIRLGQRDELDELRNEERGWSWSLRRGDAWIWRE